MSARVYSRFRCNRCGRRLPAERYVRSRFTGHRYCYPGECKRVKKAKS